MYFCIAVALPVSNFTSCNVDDCNCQVFEGNSNLFPSVYFFRKAKFMDFQLRLLLSLKLSLQIPNVHANIHFPICHTMAPCSHALRSMKLKGALPQGFFCVQLEFCAIIIA